MKKILFIAVVVTSAFLFSGWRTTKDKIVISHRPADVDMKEWALYNYKDDVEKAAEQYKVPFEFLMALIVLECDGNKPSGERFESHIYAKLRAVITGKLKRYGEFQKSDIIESGDDLKALATSHGPIQIMGYHALSMGICVSEFTSDSSIYRAAQWISESEKYMELLQASRYTDAFHLHNTGKVKPKNGTLTHDPNYCKNGLTLLKWFRTNKEITHPILIATK